MFPGCSHNVLDVEKSLNTTRNEERYMSCETVSGHTVIYS